MMDILLTRGKLDCGFRCFLIGTPGISPTLPRRPSEFVELIIHRSFSEVSEPKKRLYDSARGTRQRERKTSWWPPDQEDTRAGESPFIGDRERSSPKGGLQARRTWVHYLQRLARG